MLLPWIKALHILGAFTWFAGLVTALHLLSTETKLGGSADFDKRQAGVARWMEAGAGLTVVFGLWLLLQSLYLLKGGGFMHAKLTLVVALIGLHGFVRVQLKRHRLGKGSPLPAWLVPATVAGFAAIIALIIVRPF